MSTEPTDVLFTVRTVQGDLTTVLIPMVVANFFSDYSKNPGEPGKATAMMGFKAAEGHGALLSQVIGKQIERIEVRLLKPMPKREYGRENPEPRDRAVIEGYWIARRTGERTVQVTPIDPVLEEGSLQRLRNQRLDPDADHS